MPRRSRNLGGSGEDDDRQQAYERRRPETSTLYHVVQENLDTLYGAVEDGALAIALPKFVRKELEGYPR